MSFSNLLISALSCILWAWERPEDLRCIDTKRIAVAPLVQTVRLIGDKVTIYRRRQPLQLVAGTQLIPVTRIEVDNRVGPSLSQTQSDQVVQRILATASNAETVQIDFDAKLNERAFYKEVLRKLRTALPANTKISITSLASWAFYDDWLGNDTNVDEVVPMFFQMGVGRTEVLSLLSKGKQLAPRYRSALGLSVSSPDNAAILKWAATNQPRAKLYFFNPKPWSPRTVQYVSDLQVNGSHH